MRKIKGYILNAAIITAAGVTAGLAIGGLDLLPDTAGRIAGVIVVLGLMAAAAKIPNAGHGKHQRGN
tara:strand:+ start:446 stop:646 length:201 start_codon:yes stop_codon:yes gene_type:complete